MSTSIDQLLAGEGGGNNSMSEVDAILNELNSKQHQQQHQHQHQQQQQAPKQITGPSNADMRNNQMMKQLAEQQGQLAQLSQMNREKDMFIQQNIQNQEKKVDNTTSVDLLTEFKSTIILFIVVTIFTLPILNNLITKSLGIENDNTIFAILKTFIMAIIFFLLNKFL